MDAHREVSLERRAIISRRSVLGAALGLLGAGLLAPSMSRAASKVQLGIVPVNALTGVYLGGPKPWAGTDIDVESVPCKASQRSR